jgi:hypothetical protein
VLRCRYGEIPRPGSEVKSAHGMVSASYLEKYQADQAEQSAGPAPSHRIGVESHMIRGWDGTSSYLATWHVINDDIDSSSVCLNYKRGSIDYRECRKGAKQWFKDQCQQAGRGAGEGGGITKRRYCSAASTFSPMG